MCSRCRTLYLLILVFGVPGVSTVYAGSFAQQVSEARIRAVAKAYVEVQDLREQYFRRYPRIQELDSTRVVEVRRQFTQEVDEILEENDINREIFARLIKATHADQQLKERFLAAVEAAGGTVPQR